MLILGEGINQGNLRARNRILVLASCNIRASEGEKSFCPQKWDVREENAGAALLLKALGVQNLSGSGSDHGGHLWLRKNSPGAGFLQWGKWDHLPFRLPSCSVHFNPFLFWHQRPSRAWAGDFECIEQSSEQLQWAVPEPRPPSSNPEHLLSTSPEHQKFSASGNKWPFSLTDGLRLPESHLWPGGNCSDLVQVWKGMLVAVPDPSLLCLQADALPCACTSCLGDEFSVCVLKAKVWEQRNEKEGCSTSSK